MSDTAPQPPPGARGQLVTLPSEGAWVQLHHYDDLLSEHREQVMRKFPSDGDFSPVNVLFLQREVAVVMVEAWHLPYRPGAPLPVDDPAILSKLRVRDEKRLYKALEPVLDLFNPDKVDPADHEKPDSPTGPSGGSAPA